MRIRRCTTYTTAILLATARAIPTITVDDGDPSIEYHGAWTHNPWGNQSVNYGSSVTFTNASGSTATYKFQDFEPADRFVSYQYNQKFFQSDTLSDEEHTLVITNLGEEFWFDYLVVTQASSPMTMATMPTTLQPVQTTSESTAQTAPSTTIIATLAETSSSQPETAQSMSAPSLTQSTRSFSNTESVALTSTDSPGPPPLDTNSASQPQTSVPASNVASPTSTATHAHPTKLPAGAIAGLTIAALLVLIIAGLVGYTCRRREGRVRRQDNPTPYDPGLTALAFLEKQNFAHDNNSNAGLSMARSLPTYVYPPTTAQGHVSERGAGEHGAPNEVRTSDRNGLMMDPDLRTVYEPLASPLSASPFLARHPRERLDLENPPVTHSAGRSRYVGLLDENTRRRYMDGGVRIAGGPPIRRLSPDDPWGGDDDGQSGLSTLPPSYQLHSAI